MMKNNEDEQISEGLNQIFEIINAKGDIGELNEIMEKANAGQDKNEGKAVD